MARRGTYLVIVSALGLAAGCNAIFGLEEVEPLPVQGAGGTTSSSGGSGQGAGGASASSTGGAGGATSSTTGVGGQGGTGGAPGVCDATTLGTTIGCNPGEKCSVTSVPTGTAGCVPEGPRPAWAECTVDSQCTAGTWCDQIRRVCKPVCNAAACPTAGPCLAARDGNAVEIPNLMVCVADCEPVGATPCNQLNGDVSCVRTLDGFDCHESAGAAKNSSCTSDRVCAPGLICYQSTFCDEWCAMGGNDCPGGFFCFGFNPPLTSQDGNTEFGICALM